MANSVDPDQTASIGAVCSGLTLFASMLNSSVMLGNYLQQTTSADDIFRCIFFLGALRVNIKTASKILQQKTSSILSLLKKMMLNLIFYGYQDQYHKTCGSTVAQW